MDKHPAWTTAGVICTSKASRNLPNIYSFWWPEDKEYSVSNHLQTRLPKWTARCTGKKECQPPAGYWCCCQEAFHSCPATFCIIWDQSYARTWWSRGHAASLHRWCNTKFCTSSSASLLRILGIHHWHFQYMPSPDFPSLVLGSSLDGTTLPSDCLGWHRRSALRNLSRLATEQLIKKGDYLSWKCWAKHHQYFNYQMSAASHGTIQLKTLTFTHLLPLPKPLFSLHDIISGIKSC